jgi:hypothetical protein
MTTIMVVRRQRVNELYSLPNIVRVIKPRRTRWARHVARLGEGRGVYRVLVGNLRERGYLEEPDVYGRIILRWDFRKWIYGSMNWIELAQDRNSWRALVNAVMNLQVP